MSISNMSRKRRRSYRIREAIRVRPLVFLWTWRTISMVSQVLEPTKRSMGLNCQKMTQKVEEGSQPIFYCDEPFSKGDLTSKEGKQTQTKKNRNLLACNQ